MSEKVNLHIHGGVFKNGTRIIKETKSIINLGLADEILILSIWEPGLQKEEYLTNEILVKRLTILSKKLPQNIIGKILSFIEYELRILLKYSFTHFHSINAHSLNVLFIGVLLKRKKTLLIYDAHELETERASMGKINKRISKPIERFLIRYINRLIVVCKPIYDWYLNEYDLASKKVFIVRNVPDIQGHNEVKLPQDFFKQQFSISDDNIVFIYQGILSKLRGLDSLTEAFSNLEKKNKDLVLMGFGPSESDIINLSKEESNIHFHPAVDPSEILEFTSKADVGIFFIEGEISLSYQYSLPNKFGEYLNSGLPVIVSNNLTYLSSIIKENNLGWVVNNSKESLEELITSITFDEIKGKQKSIYQFVKSFNWEFEEAQFPAIYNTSND